MQKTKETWVWSLGQEYSWRRKLHSFNNLVWRILWTEEPGGEQSMDLQRVGHNWVSEHSINNLCLTICHGILNIYFKYLYNICSGNRDQIANICWIMKKAREFQKNIYFCFIDYAKAFDCVDHNKLWKILQEMGIPDHLTGLLRNRYAGQEATVGTGYGKTDWFQIGKGVHQGCILLPCLFNLYAEYIMRNTGLE